MNLIAARIRQVSIITSAVLLLLLFLVATVYAAGRNLTTPGSSTTINGAIFQAFSSDDPSGSGAFHSFVRLGGKSAVIAGYNTDYRALQFNENASQSFTKSILLSDIPIVDQGGPNYRAFHLDINQKASRNDRYLTLNTVELYESPDSNLCGYPFDGSGGGHTGCSSNNTATLIYDMDGGENSFVVLNSRNSAGSGGSDLRLLVPDSLFNQNPNCRPGGDGCTVYVTLYSTFGADFDAGSGDPLLQIPHGNNGGFEEWGLPK